MRLALALGDEVGQSMPVAAAANEVITLLNFYVYYLHGSYTPKLTSTYLIRPTVVVHSVRLQNNQTLLSHADIQESSKPGFR